MKKVLYVLTREDDPLAEAIVAADRAAGEVVEVVRLTAVEADYQHLLEVIFAADSVQSW